LNWNKWIRQTHRWLSIAFTVAVIVNIVAVVTGRYAAWVGLLAVAPLAVLFSSGLHLFALPLCHQVGQRASHRLNGLPAARRKGASPAFRFFVRRSYPLVIP
jgi:uncharacterized protein (DUF58 family)